MPSAIISLSDGIGVEVDVPQDQVERVGNAVFDRVEQSLDQIGAISKKVVQSVTATAAQCADSVAFEGLEVEYGLSFSGEGNVYIAKFSGSTNIKIKLKLKPTAIASSTDGASQTAH